MKLYVIVVVSLEFVRVKYLDGTFVPPSTNGLSLAKIDLDMDHFMRKRLKSWVSVGCAIEHQVSWFQVFLSEPFIRQQIKLISLVPFAQSVPEILSEIENTLPHQCTAIEEKRC